MPELPEVETTRQLLEECALDKIIVKVEAVEDTLLFEGQRQSEVVKSLLHQKIVKTGRHGKVVWLEMKKKPHVSFHLGMTGRIVVSGKPVTFYYRFPATKCDEWPPKYYKLLLTLNDGTKIAFTDPRRFGRIRIHKIAPKQDKPVTGLGYDPLHGMCDLKTFCSLLETRTCTLKGALLDQSFVAGVGNWIADEVCYQSGIHPRVKCNALTQTQMQRLFHAIQQIVRYACAVSADYHKFPSNWLFHYRWDKGKVSPKKKKKSNAKVHKDFYDNDIIFETIATRTTAIVPSLQTLAGCREFTNSDEKGNPNLTKLDPDCKTAESTMECTMEPATDTPIDTAMNTTIDTPMIEHNDEPKRSRRRKTKSKDATNASQEILAPVKKVLKKKSGRRKKVSSDNADTPKTVIIRRSSRLAKKYAKEV